MWDTSSGDCKSQIGCDLKIQSKLPKWNFTRKSSLRYSKRILLMEVHITNIKNGEIKHNRQINTIKNNAMHSIQEIKRKKNQQTVK